MKAVLFVYLGFCAFYVGVIVISNKISQLPDENRLRQWWQKHIVYFDDLDNPW